MSKRTRSKKLSRGDKTAISALSMLGLVGGWALVGNLEETSAENAAVVELAPPTPTAVQQVIGAWPTIEPLSQTPRLYLEALPTLVPGPSLGVATDMTGQQIISESESASLAKMSVAAPLPTLAPLPAMPEYVPPPPPPPPPKSNPSPNNGGGGGNRSKGS